MLDRVDDETHDVGSILRHQVPSTRAIQLKLDHLEPSPRKTPSADGRNITMARRSPSNLNSVDRTDVRVR